MAELKFTDYFIDSRERPDRAAIRLEWIEETAHNPTEEQVQSDGRIRRWRFIPEADPYLRVVLLEDGVTVHNAFFDRRFKESGG